METGALIALISIGVGTLLSIGGLLLGAYKVRLDAERDRAEISSRRVDDGLVARIEELEDRVERLAQRTDFTEKLLESGERRELPGR